VTLTIIAIFWFEKRKEDIVLFLFKIYRMSCLPSINLFKSFKRFPLEMCNYSNVQLCNYGNVHKRSDFVVISTLLVLTTRPNARNGSVTVRAFDITISPLKTLL